MAVKIRDEFIDELVKDCKTADDIVGSQGVVKELTKRLLEKLLDTELTTHLGYVKNKTPEKKKGDARNGHSAKTILTGEDELELKIPRDRKGEKHLCRNMPEVIIEAKGDGSGGWTGYQFFISLNSKRPFQHPLFSLKTAQSVLIVSYPWDTDGTPRQAVHLNSYQYIRSSKITNS